MIPYKQAIQEITDAMNKALAKMPDDETRQTALDALSKQMFCKTEKAEDKCD